MSAPRRDFAMSLTGGRAWWTGREVMVLLARPGWSEGEHARFDVGVSTPGR